MQLPEYYRHPERYKWFVLETDRGPKRTFAKTKKEAITKAEKKGLTVIKIIEHERIKFNKNN